MDGEVKLIDVYKYLAHCSCAPQCVVCGQAVMAGMHGTHIMVQQNTATQPEQSWWAPLRPHCDIPGSVWACVCLCSCDMQKVQGRVGVIYCQNWHWYFLLASLYNPPTHTETQCDIVLYPPTNSRKIFSCLSLRHAIQTNFNNVESYFHKIAQTNAFNHDKLSRPQA